MIRELLGTRFYETFDADHAPDRLFFSVATAFEPPRSLRDYWADFDPWQEPRTNVLHLVVVETEWRSYRGQRKIFICSLEIPGNDQQQTVDFRPEDFRGINSTDGESKSWDVNDPLGLRCQFDDGKGGFTKLAGATCTICEVGWECRSAHAGRPKPLRGQR